MIDRYALYEIENLRDRFQLGSGVPKGVKKHYNISPTQTNPVVVSRDNKPEVELMKWGFIPHGAKDTNSVFRYKTFNARSEGIFEKPSWQQAIRTRRCLVPANGFYQWKSASDGKKAFFVRLNDQALFAFAGIYSSWIDPDGVECGTYTIITTEASNGIRNPIILRPGDEAQWLDPTIDDANTLYASMRPYSEDMFSTIQVSQDVNSLKVDKPHLITPLN